MGLSTPRPERAGKACQALSRQGSPQATRSAGLYSPPAGLLKYRGCLNPAGGAAGSRMRARCVVRALRPSESSWARRLCRSTPRLRVSMSNVSSPELATHRANDAPPYGRSLLLSIRHPERPTSALLCHPLSGHHQPSNPQPTRSPSWLPLVLVLSVVNQHAAARSLPPHALHLASP
jgi:hypothetical protein